MKRVRELVSSGRKLSGANARARANNPDNLDLLREGILILRHALKQLKLKDFEINWTLEAEAFSILKTLASVAVTCLNDYRREKLAENYLDFQDLQLKVFTLISTENHRHITEELRSRYLYIMVDEFQDTNDLQWKIVGAIAPDGKSKLFGDRLN